MELTAAQAAAVRDALLMSIPMHFAAEARPIGCFAVEIDLDRLVRSCRRAAMNKGRRRKDGPLTIRFREAS